MCYNIYKFKYERKMEMKKLISVLMAASVAAAMAVPAFAADKEKGEPDVYVDGSRILFKDQNAVIVDDITLVPARGVFEAMGNTVKWDGDARKVTVSSSTGVRDVVLTIDSDVMTVKTYKTLFDREDKDITLEVPAKIMNDRTMIPLRAVSEAFDCKVEWDGDAYKVDITTGKPILLEGYAAPEMDEKAEAEKKAKMLSMALSTDAEKVAAGEEFTVYIEAKNIPETSFVSAVSAVFEYDKEKFEYVSSAMLDNNNKDIEQAQSSANSEYRTGTKAVYLMLDEAAARDTDGRVFRVTFKKLTDGEGTIALGNSYDMLFSYESYLMLTLKEAFAEGLDNIDTEFGGKDLALDTTPITIK